MFKLCEHEKVYCNDLVLLSLPAKFPWKCKRCGKEGYDIEKNNSAIKKINEEIDIAK